MNIQTRIFALAIGLAVSVFGQLRTPGPQQPAPERDKPAAEAEAPKTESPLTARVGQAVDPKSYLIGAEDIIFVEVWRHPEFTRQHIVRSDGKISLPLHGEVEAAGKTPDALSKDVAKALAEFVNKPDVSVTILQVNSKKFFVNGEVQKPGSFPLVGKITVLEAISMSGGFREFAGRKKITILRAGKTHKFNWVEVSKGKKMEQNILLEPGDHIFVP